MKQNYSLTERKRWLTPPLKLFILLSVFCIAICPELQAQGKTRTIKGRVIDAVTKEPIIGANIWLKETSVGRMMWRAESLQRTRPPSFSRRRSPAVHNDNPQGTRRRCVKQ